MRWRAYNGGSCQHCGADIGYVESEGGRTRKYCSQKCRQAAYTLKIRQDKRYKELLRFSLLMRRWEDGNIQGEVRKKLIEIYIKTGDRQAVELATDLVTLVSRDVFDRVIAQYA